MNFSVLIQLVVGDSVEERHAGGARYAQFGEFFDVVLDGCQITASSARHHEGVDVEGQGTRSAGGVYVELSLHDRKIR